MVAITVAFITADVVVVVAAGAAADYVVAGGSVSM